MRATHTITSLAFVLLGAVINNGNAQAEASKAPPRLGVQLWSVKEEIRRDFDGTLASIARLGFQGVEFAGQFGPYRNNPGGLKALLDKHGLECAGAHVMLGQLAPQRFETTTAFYRALGCSNLVIPVDGRGMAPLPSAELGKELAALSATLAAKGMRIGYHNHAQEMSGAIGSTPWDVIARSTPQHMILQQDVGWTRLAGKDPAAYIRRYPGRTVTTHFKATLAEGSQGKPIIGQDNADWASLIRALREAGGTDWIIVEQEEYPDGMGQLEAVAASLEGLKALMRDGASK